MGLLARNVRRPRSGRAPDRLARGASGMPRVLSAARRRDSAGNPPSMGCLLGLVRKREGCRGVQQRLADALSNASRTPSGILWAALSDVPLRTHTSPKVSCTTPTNAAEIHGEPRTERTPAPFGPRARSPRPRRLGYAARTLSCPKAGLRWQPARNMGCLLGLVRKREGCCGVQQHRADAMWNA